MKKLLLASAVAALSITAAQAAPTVYGKAFLTLDAVDGNSNSEYKNARAKLTSQASHIGVKGSEALTQNTDVVYQLEYRVNIDDDSQQFTSRDTYIGLSNKQYGTLVAGRLTTIDSQVDYANVTVGGVLGGDNVLASFDAKRVDNAVAYFSPVKNGVQLLGMYALDESKNNENDTDPTTYVNSDTLEGDAYGVGVKYEPENQPFKVGATFIEANQKGENNKSAKIVRVSGAYDVNANLTVGALYQNTDVRTEKDEKVFTLSATQKVAQTPWTVYGQLDIVDNFEGVANDDKNRLAVGGKYAFNKNATAHIYGAYQNSKNVELSRIATGTKAKAYGIGAGLEYKF